jgi:hypothetical protein
MRNGPPLRQIRLLSIPTPPLPTLRIRTDADVGTWTSTSGYQVFKVFVRVLDECVVGVEMPLEGVRAGCEVCAFLLVFFFGLEFLILFYLFLRSYKIKVIGIH